MIRTATLPRQRDLRDAGSAVRFADTLSPPAQLIHRPNCRTEMA